MAEAAGAWRGWSAAGKSAVTYALRRRAPPRAYVPPWAGCVLPCRLARIAAAGRRYTVKVVDDQLSVASGWIVADAASLYYEERGSGDPLVLVHGGLASSAMWQPLLPVLVDHFRVITPDSRGHGRSTNPSGTLSYAQIADDVAALVASLGLVRPVVGGYSDGGQVALELAVRHPGVARALIVGAAYPDFVSTGLREMSRAFLGADEAGVPDLAQVDSHLGDFAGVVKAWHTGGEVQWRALVNQTASMWLDYEGLGAEEIGSIHEPALVLAGDRDEQEGRLDLAVSLYRALPRGELGICPGADHFGPITPRHADIHAAMIRDFAQRHRGDR